MRFDNKILVIWSGTSHLTIEDENDGPKVREDGWKINKLYCFNVCSCRPAYRPNPSLGCTVNIEKYNIGKHKILLTYVQSYFCWQIVLAWLLMWEYFNLFIWIYLILELNSTPHLIFNLKKCSKKSEWRKYIYGYIKY